MKRYLAVDIGGTFIKFGVVTEMASIISTGKIKTPKTLEELLNVLEELYQQYNDVTGLALSCPGAVSQSGVIHGWSALPYLHGPNIKDLVNKRTGLPVYIENDANCAGYAEVWQGKAKGKKDVLVIVIGTGVGGAIIKDGLIHKGSHLHGGEFGYMVVPNASGTGFKTWSDTAATGALIKKVAHMKKEDETKWTGEAVFDAADNGDQDCQLAVKNFFQSLALGIYNLQYIFDPEIVLIGGGISARDDLAARINKELDILLARFKDSKVRPHVETCKHGQHANMLGAVYGFIRSQ